MKTKYMMVVGTLSVAGLMAAFSYSSATVTSAASMTVTSTDGALLALSAGQQFLDDGTAAFTTLRADSPHSLLSFNFAKGNGGQEFGVQRNSTYEWDGLLLITNNSAETIQPQVALETNATNQGQYYMETTGSNDWQWVAGGNAAHVWQGNALAPGQTVAVDMKYTLGNAQNIINKTDTPNFVVSATSVQP